MYPDEETRTSMKMSKFTERTLPEDLNIKVRFIFCLVLLNKSMYLHARLQNVYVYNLKVWAKPAEKCILDVVFSDF